jgi:hypothetical protein
MGLLNIALNNGIRSCLNSRLESTAIYWRNMFGIPLDYYGPFR